METKPLRPHRKSAVDQCPFEGRPEWIKDGESDGKLMHLYVCLCCSYN